MISGLAIARRQFWEKIVEAGDEGEPRESIWIHKCVIVKQFVSVFKLVHYPPFKWQPVRFFFM